MQETILFCLPAFQICFVSSNRICRGISTAAEAGAARELAGGGWWEGNCKLQIGNCKLGIADLRPPAGCDLFRVQKLGGNAVGVQARRSKSPFWERQRRSIIQPRVARNELPWEPGNKSKQPQRGCIPPAKSRVVRTDGTPLGFMDIVEREPRVASAAARLRQPGAE